MEYQQWEAGVTIKKLGGIGNFERYLILYFLCEMSMDGRVQVSGEYFKTTAAMWLPTELEDPEQQRCN